MPSIPSVPSGWPRRASSGTPGGRGSEVGSSTTPRDRRKPISCAAARGQQRVDEETLDGREQNPVPPQTSWLKAEPLWISPRVRQSGRHIARGSVRSVIDRTKEKELLAQLSRDESHQLAEAQRRLANGRRMRFSEMEGLLTEAELELFLDLLGEALSAKVRAEETVIAHSSDGALRIELEPAGDGREAVVRTPEGWLRGEDHYLTISRVFGGGIEEPSRSIEHSHEH